MAERVLEKARPNFCEFFEPSEDPPRDPQGPGEDSLLQAAQELFK
jgi:hypothetical protein